jgi:hypothetical protein
MMCDEQNYYWELLFNQPHSKQLILETKATTQLKVNTEQVSQVFGSIGMSFSLSFHRV